MALIKSTVLSAIRGSVNGMTFSQNKSGAYARNRSMVVNPNTGNQILARANLSTASQGWRALSPAEQLLWVNYASLTPVPNRLGDMIHLSGFNMYVKTNALMLLLEGGGTSAAPTSPGLAAPVITLVPAITDSLSGNPNSFTPNNLTGGSTNAAAMYGMWISAPVSAGVTFYKGPWTYIGPINGTNIVIPGIMTIPFDVTVDQLFFFRTRYVDENRKVSSQFIGGPIAAVNTP